MFKALTTNFSKIFDKIRREKTLTKENIETVLAEIRTALLEADVAVEVIKGFLESLKEKILGEQVIKSVKPDQMVIKLVHDEIINILSSSPEEVKLNISNKSNNTIMLVGLQGSGKTSSAAKLALKLKKEGKKVLLVSVDIYRPAAQKQLEILANSIEVDSFPIHTGLNPEEITEKALLFAREGKYDVLILDTAGRLHIDQVLMDELKNIKALSKPAEILLAVDSLIGKDSLTTAKAFESALGLSGFILTKVDADARGGSALSIKHVTGKPIKFITRGEKVDALEEFNAERIASRILDMGDVVSLVEKAQELVTEEEAARLEKKMMKGQFNLQDYLTQLSMLKKVGVKEMLSFLPGASKFEGAISKNPMLEDKNFIKQQAIILSMTPKERRHPALLNQSRKLRIAKGSGTTINDVTKTLKNHAKIESSVKKFAKLSKSESFMSKISQLFS